jgi:pimeloyl-ACP methyl ester carboxylesterase
MPRVHLNGVEMHYQSVGTGPDIIMIHGLAANLAFWYLRLVPLLSTRFRVTSYDLRGHGYSSMPTHGYNSAEMARDLQALMDHIGIGRANIVGHSFGGAVALHFTLFFPERVKTVTLADAWVHSLQPLPKHRETHYWDVWRQSIQQLGINIPDDMPHVAYSLIEESAREKNIGRELHRLSLSASFGMRIANGRTRKRWHTLLHSTSALNDFADPVGLTACSIHQIKLPVLAIYGEYSHCMPTCNRLAQLLGQCTTVIVPNVGHFHPSSRPVNFTKHLFRFLKCHDQDLLRTTQVSTKRR